MCMCVCVCKRLVIPMTKIFFSDMFVLPQCLPHSSPNPWSFGSDKISGSIFCKRIWSLVLSSWEVFRVVMVKWVSLFIISPLAPQWVYVNEGSGEAANDGRPIPPLPGRREGRARGGIKNQWPVSDSILPLEWSLLNPEDRLQRAWRLESQGASMCHPAGPKLLEDTGSFVWDLALRVSSCGCDLYSLISFATKH